MNSVTKEKLYNLYGDKANDMLQKISTIIDENKCVKDLESEINQNTVC